MDISPIYVRNQYKVMEYPVNPSIKHSSYYLNNLRKDLTHLNIYTIDPSGSTDADDGFSIVDHSDNCYDLYIHIADPTSFFEVNDPVFKCIRLNGVSQYPLFNQARHMFHSNYVNACTLINGMKPAITVKICIQDDIIVSKECILSTIHCDPEYRFTYENVGHILKNKIGSYYNDLLKVKTITDMMRSQRTTRTSTLSIPAKISLINNKIVYRTFDEYTIRTKQMIEELAIQTNHIIANIILDNKGNQILNRSCTSLKEGILTETGNFILDIISNEFRAKYGTQIDKHIILNLETYCHFTSPLRRFSDCITHFILKHSLFQGNSEPLFNDHMMNHYAMVCNNAARKHRNASFADNKYRLYQYIRQELEYREYVELKYVHSGMTGNFINALVIGIDDYNTNITYTLVSDNNMDRELIRSLHGIANTINITKCNIQQTRYDKGTLPELEDEIIRYFG